VRNEGWITTAHMTCNGSSSIREYCRSVAVFLCVACCFLIGTGTVVISAQDDYLRDIGIPRFSLQLPVEQGYINAGNGDLHLEIPLGTFPQRGGHPVTVAIMYDSAIWAPINNTTWTPNSIRGSDILRGGWRVVTSGDPGTVDYDTVDRYVCNIDLAPGVQDFKNWTWTSTQGTTHRFAIVTSRGYKNACGDYTAQSHLVGNAMARDASGYFMSVSNAQAAIVYSPDGTKIDTDSLATQSPKDTNGNYFTTNLYASDRIATDSLGRTLVTVAQSGNTLTYSVLNEQNGTTPYVVTTKTINYSSNFRSAGSTLADLASSMVVVQSIQLPDGTRYSFSYDEGTTAGHYGQLTSMTLPTGSQITYTYANFSDASYSPFHHVTRGISTRTTPGGTWRYTPQVITFCTSTSGLCRQKLTIVKPSGDNTVYTFDIAGGVWPVQADYYSGAISPGNLLATIIQTFDYSQPGGANVTKQRATITLPTLGGGTVSQTTNYSWDTTSFSNLTLMKEWNFYSGSLPATADRTTTIAYLSDSNPNYLNSHILDRPTTVTVTDKNGAIVSQTLSCYDYAGSCGGSSFVAVTGRSHHDDNYGPSLTVRGDLTQVKRLVSGASSYLTTTMTYDTIGQVITSTDSHLNQTAYSYADSFFNDIGDGAPPSPYAPPAPTNAYLTSVTHGGLTSNFGYYWGTGQRALSKDANAQPTYYHFYDSMNRPTSTKFPDGGWTYITYPNGSQTQTDTYLGITSTSFSGCTSCRHDQQLLDGLGRLSSKLLVSDPEGGTTVATSYDSNGRVSTVSNPYRSTSEGTYGWNAFLYDGLDRKTRITHTDGDTVRFSYGAAVGPGGGASSQLCSSTYGLGYPILRVDEVGNKSQTWTDGFGRIIEVDEPDATGVLSLATCYAYDLNNNLTGVAQGSQSRSFAFDKLSRLTSSSLPETGTTNLFYTAADGTTLCSGDPEDVCRRTDARGITTTYSYDALNRLISKTYSDATPPVTYYYDQTSYNGLTITNPLGRRTGMTDSSGATAWSYDSLGRVLSLRRKINGISNTANYQYNLDGSIADLTYFSGTHLAYTYSNAQRQLSAIDPYPINFAKAAHYSPWGALTDVAFGAYNTGFQGTILSNSYNNRLQPTLISAASPTLTVFSLSYSFNQGTVQSPLNNGNVVTIQNNRDGNRTQAFAYDPMGRIISAQTPNSTLWGNTYVIDRWGNLTNKNAISGKVAGENLQEVVNAKNQFTDRTYDAAGNMTNDGNGNTFSYDAENRLTSSSGGSSVAYLYNGDGNRVQKYISPSNGTLYWQGIEGETINESNLTASVWKRFVFFSGKRIARRDSDTAKVYYFFSDHLGSIGVVTDDLGQTILNESDYYPYGGERLISNTVPDQHYKFTGKERDSETGNDYFGARYYNSNMGRFLSADPVMIMRQKMLDPQQWNMYSYARNNPLGFKDENGKWPTSIHNQIIDHAFPGLSVAQRNELKRTSAWVDRVAGQTKAHNHEHAMKSPGENPAASNRAIDQNIQNHEQAAQRAQGGTPEHAAQINNAALGEFGQALHTVEDRTSSAHTDANGNPRDWNGIPGTLSGYEAVKQHEAEESTISPEQMNNSVQAARDAFGQTFGQKAEQEAQTPPPPPPPRKKEPPE